MISGIVMSDTHLHNLDKLAHGLATLTRNAQVVIHAGDFDTYNFISELQKNSKELYAVAGNCDFESPLPLPQKLVFELGGVKIGLCHGAGRRDNIIERLFYTFHDDEPQIIIFGHTHIPLIEKVDGVTFINPGSPTQNRNCTYGTCCSLNIENGFFEAQILRTDKL